MVKVVVDAYCDAKDRSWLWVFTGGSLLPLAWWMNVMEVWSICRPGLPRRRRIVVQAVLTITHALLRCGYLALRSLNHGNENLLMAVIALMGVLVEFGGSFFLVPLIFCKGTTATVRHARGKLVGVYVLAALMILWGLVSASLDSVVRGDTTSIEMGAFVFLFPILGLLISQRTGGKCAGEQGHNPAYCVLYILFQRSPWVVGRFFTAIQEGIAIVLANYPWLEGMAQSGAMVCFMIACSLLRLTLELLARQIGEPRHHLSRAALLFPVVFMQALFLQSFMIAAVFLSPRYVMQFIVLFLVRVALQAGILPILQWYMWHRFLQRMAGRSSPKSAALGCLGMQKKVGRRHFPAAVSLYSICEASNGGERENNPEEDTKDSNPGQLMSSPSASSDTSHGLVLAGMPEVMFDTVLSVAFGLTGVSSATTGALHWSDREDRNVRQAGNDAVGAAACGTPPGMSNIEPGATAATVSPPLSPLLSGPRAIAGAGVRGTTSDTLPSVWRYNDASAVVLPCDKTPSVTTIGGSCPSSRNTASTVQTKDSPYEEVSREFTDCQVALQEGTLTAIIVANSRSLLILNLAQVVCSMVMFVVVASESVIFELQGQPECCILKEVAQTMDEPKTPHCRGHDINEALVLRNGLTNLCPRVTGRHTQMNRWLLMLHFFLHTILMIIGWKVGSKVRRTVLLWARNNADGIESNEEKQLTLDLDQVEPNRVYIRRFQRYITAIMVWIIIVVLTALRATNHNF
eukprot:NODE_1010_length_2653_cov_7.171021.p1 GENE.NODE_1010_length_2653_cov_7.171021~~NODE_1010_length_2653_cov_7.171021.p1  ORF type:complete len:803 (+),score=139.62 NODE_1010_length_2653_cov_7.171021:175-2409(+)